MLIDPFMPYVTRRRRLKPKATAVPTPPVIGPVLVAASFDGESLLLMMRFDRDVNADGVVPAAVTVIDGENALLRYVAEGNTQFSGGAEVGLLMRVDEAVPPGDVRLSAGADNGIVEVDGGATWAGVADVQLPFGEINTGNADAKQIVAKKSRRKRAA